MRVSRDTHAGSLSRPRCLDKSPQSDRCATGLCLKPLPVPGQQRHFTRDDAELWPTRTTRSGGGLARPRSLFEAASDVLVGAPQVEIDLSACAVVEYQRHRAIRQFLQGEGDLQTRA